VSLESLIVLLLFVVVPLLQGLARRRRTGKLEPNALEDLDTDELELERAPAPQPQRAPHSMPWPPLPASEPGAVYRSPPKQPTRPTAVPPAHGREGQPRSIAAARSPRAPAPETRARPNIMPRDRAGLRRAMVLSAILGPPRALQPPES